MDMDMENRQMFVPESSMQIFHALNKNNTSFDSNMLPRMFQTVHHQEQAASPGLETLKETTRKKKVRKQRVAFQTRSHVDVLDDGYRWRKYGQKAVKNNKFPRNYYRCTHQGCNVKKQVQRLTKDEEVVMTTYEGTHTHLVEKSTENFEHILSQMQIYPHLSLIN